MSAPIARDASAAASHAAVRHDSAVGHVTGRALYLDDMPNVPGTLEAALVLSPHAHARIRSIDFSRALAAPGVVAAIAAADIPGKNDIAPIRSDEPLLPQALVEYEGQPVAAIAAPHARPGARRRASWSHVDYEPLPAVLTVEDAIAREHYVSPPQIMARGDVDGRARRRAASPRRRTALRRPGSFLSRRPDRARHSGRRRRHAGLLARPSIRPRCSTASRICSACRSTPSPWKCGAWAAPSAARRARPPSSPASRRCSPGRRGAR